MCVLCSQRIYCHKIFIWNSFGAFVYFGACCRVQFSRDQTYEQNKNRKLHRIANKYKYILIIYAIHLLYEHIICTPDGESAGVTQICTLYTIKERKSDIRKDVSQQKKDKNININSTNIDGNSNKKTRTRNKSFPETFRRFTPKVNDETTTCVSVGAGVYTQKHIQFWCALANGVKSIL